MMAAIDDDVEALGEKVCRDPRYTESTIKKFFDYYYLASFFLLSSFSSYVFRRHHNLHPKKVLFCF